MRMMFLIAVIPEIATLTAIDWTVHFYGVSIWDQISAQERTTRNLWCTILTVTARQKCV